jgi:hypothetical protein
MTALTQIVDHSPFILPFILVGCNNVRLCWMERCFDARPWKVNRISVSVSGAEEDGLEKFDVLSKPWCFPCERTTENASLLREFQSRTTQDRKLRKR